MDFFETQCRVMGLPGQEKVGDMCQTDGHSDGHWPTADTTLYV